MSKKLTQSKMMDVLEWGYDKALNGIAGMDGAIILAESYKDSNKTLLEQVESLVRWQNTKCATSGFITGLGGILTLPIAIPANVASTLYIQIRMILAIAHLGGYDIRDDKVKSLVYMALVGNEAKEILKDIAIQVGKQMARQMIRNISKDTIIKINQKVAFRLVTKFGEKGVINLGKTVPLVGGIIGGTADAIYSNIVGNAAIRIFIDEKY